MVETDEFARKRQQLEQLKTDLENKLGASRVQWTTAIREGHSSNQERTAFINNYEAQCSRLRERGAFPPRALGAGRSPRPAQL